MAKGIIALMGSGELTSTMVEVHKEIMRRINCKRPVFLDTPAGFQLNVDQISKRAVEYFRTRVGYEMSVVSYKSGEIPPLQAQKAFSKLREADYILVGPGSPTYAVRQWINTPIPEIFINCLTKGGCLVAASAAALTIGKFTLPVYEIYKVGSDLHWADGLDILGKFGLDFIVIPHWNNAEGGTHDTRFCFMGEERFKRLKSMLPEDTGVLGIDEHTACIIDLEKQQVHIRGIGKITIQRGDDEITFKSGERFPVGMLKGQSMEPQISTQPEVTQEDQEKRQKETFWDRVHAVSRQFHQGIEDNVDQATGALLELDSLIWEGMKDLESEEFISQARDLYRELIVLMGHRLASAPKSKEACISVLVEEILKIRERFRREKRWEDADTLRDALKRAGVVVEDTTDGPKWRLIQE